LLSAAGVSVAGSGVDFRLGVFVCWIVCLLPDRVLMSAADWVLYYLLLGVWAAGSGVVDGFLLDLGVGVVCCLRVD